MRQTAYAITNCCPYIITRLVGRVPFYWTRTGWSLSPWDAQHYASLHVADAAAAAAGLQDYSVHTR